MVRSALRMGCVVLVLLAYTSDHLWAQATPEPVAALTVTWVDWPNSELAADPTAQAEGYRDRPLEQQVSQELRQVLQRNGIDHDSAADVVIQVAVNSTRVVESYTDSLFGTQQNRPAQYKGEFSITVLRAAEQLSSHVQSFSISSGRTVGNTTYVAQAKIRGMIGKWLDKHVGKKKFRKQLRGVS